MFGFGFQVGRLVHAIKMGWIKPRPKEVDDEDADDLDRRKFYLLWDKDDNVSDQTTIT